MPCWPVGNRAAAESSNAVRLVPPMSRSFSGRSLCFAAALFFVTVASAPRATAQTYKLDAGTAGSALSCGLPEDLCWLDVLHVSGTATLTSIEAMFGDAPDGTPVTLCVWRDLGQYGRPWDGLLLTQVTTVVQNSGKTLFTQYPIPPTQVSGSFFVGAVMTCDGTTSPATIDPHTPGVHDAWWATGYGPGTFDPTFLGVWSWNGLPVIGKHGVFMIRANGIDGPSPETRCVAKANSLGCLPTVSFAGTASASAGSGFTVTAANVLNKKSGMFAYSLQGVQQVPFAGGYLCLRPPLERTNMLASGGSVSGSDCTGTLAIDFNSYVASGADPALVAGVTVDGQFWSRDPGFAAPDNVGLTQGAHFGIGP